MVFLKEGYWVPGAPVAEDTVVLMGISSGKAQLWVQAPVVDVEGYVLRHGTEMTPPVLSPTDQHQEKQNKTGEVTQSSHFLPMLLHK